MSTKAVTLAAPFTTTSPLSYESEHVHNVYEAIAPHFSSTRYKPWPVVAEFLASLPAGSVGLDSGTGNGKYLPLEGPGKSGDICTIGLDRSRGLLEIAKTAGGKERECVLGDALGICWREAAFDYAISIATIHHLSTPERRKAAVQSLIRCLSPSHGRGLIYVWATQQDSLSKRSLPPSTSANSSESQRNARGQDVFVPWVLSDNLVSKPSPPSERENERIDSPPVYKRYYHMFDAGELRELVNSAADEIGVICRSRPSVESNTKSPNSSQQSKQRHIEIVKDDWERSNYYVEFRLWEG